MLHVQNGFLRFIKNILPINFSIILNQFCAISLGVFFKFLFIGIYLWLTDKDLSWIANPMGYLGLFFFYIFFIEIYFILANISSSVYWFCAKKKGGSGTFPETCLTLILTGLYTFIFAGFSFLFIILGYKLDSFLVCIFSFFGLIASLIFGIVKMSIQTAKINGFHSDRGTNVFLCGTLLQLPFYYQIYKLIIHYYEPFI
ncbi:MAG: hypothetical protein LW832_02930 [Parachlamydia sp.]|nr:hypothetical protein [Parachlamydia sp.]